MGTWHGHARYARGAGTRHAGFTRFGYACPMYAAMQNQLKRIDHWRAIHWLIMILSVLVVGPACSALFGRLMDADGGHAVTMLVSGRLVDGLLAGGAVLGAAAIMAFLGAYFCSAGVGFTAAALVLGWGAWRTTNIDALIRRSRSADDLLRVALESGLVILIVMGISLIIMRITAARTRAYAAGGIVDQHSTVKGLWAWWVQSDSRDPGAPRVVLLTCIACAATASLVAAIACISTAKGQAVFAAFIASVAAGWIAQLVARSMHCTPSPGLVVAGCVVPAVVGPLVAVLVQGSGITITLFAGDLIPLARIMPWDWACGVMLGVPVGLSWAGAMIDQRAAEE
jgi:hypothetical protein